MPPLVPRLIVTAIAPPADYESVIGDLHEEFVRRVACAGRVEANRWYLSQALRSIPSLLSYARSTQSMWVRVATVVVAALVVIAMMFCFDRACEAIATIHTCAVGNGLCTWPYFLSGWAIAAAFGAMLTGIVRSQSIRLTLLASLGLVASIAIPTALGFSSPLPAVTWLLLVSAIPAMSAGSAIYVVVRRR